MNARCLALVTLGRFLKKEGYRFVVVNPTTHERVLNRPEEQPTLRSIFGWNRAFDRNAISPHLFDLLSEADVLSLSGDRYRSTVRFATIDDMLFAHSAFPTVETDAVFFGPDTYRFVRLVRSALVDIPIRTGITLIDVGTGSGAGGLCAARGRDAATIRLADVNPRALEISAVNAAINDLKSVEIVFSDVLSGIEGNPTSSSPTRPICSMNSSASIATGAAIWELRWHSGSSTEGLARLTPGGRLVLYTGTPIVGGIDALFDLIEPLLQLHCSQFVYEEIDPDVFGEELEKNVYASVDRIAAVGLVAVK